MLDLTTKLFILKKHHKYDIKFCKRFMAVKETGTTTIGLIYKDGVILAADRRMSADHIVAHKNAEKVLPLSENIGITTAGLVADLQTLVKVMQAEIQLHDIRSSERMSTKAAVGLLSSILFNKRMSLNIFYTEFIIGGYDTKQELYAVDEVGSYTLDKYTVTGSGGVFALGVLEAEYKDNMSLEDAVKLANKAVKASIARDVYTGEGVDIAVIDKKGYRKLTDEEINKIVSQ